MEYAVCDMEWLAEAKAAVTAYRNGQQARGDVDKVRAAQKAG